MALGLFAGIAVTDYERALSWYERLPGSGPSLVPNHGEAVWDLAADRSVYIEHRPEHAGHSMHLIFVDDLDAEIAEIAARGIEPAKQETYSNGIRKRRFETPMATRSASGHSGPPFPARSPRTAVTEEAVENLGRSPADGLGPPT